MLIYFTREQPEDWPVSNTVMGFFSGITFMFGAVCSAFSGYAGMWVSVRANTRYFSGINKKSDCSCEGLLQ